MDFQLLCHSPCYTYLSEWHPWIEPRQRAQVWDEEKEYHQPLGYLGCPLHSLILILHRHQHSSPQLGGVTWYSSPFCCGQLWCLQLYKNGYFLSRCFPCLQGTTCCLRLWTPLQVGHQASSPCPSLGFQILLPYQWGYLQVLGSIFFSFVHLVSEQVSVWCRTTKPLTQAFLCSWVTSQYRSGILRPRQQGGHSTCIDIMQLTVQQTDLSRWSMVYWELCLAGELLQEKHKMPQ